MTYNKTHNTKSIKLLEKMSVYFYILLLLFTSSCAMKFQEGYIIEKKYIQEIKLGMPQEDVVKILGNPSLQFDLNENETLLFYIQIDKLKRAFFKPKIITQTTLKLQFKESKLIDKQETTIEKLDNEYQSLDFIKQIPQPTKDD